MPFLKRLAEPKTQRDRDTRPEGRSATDTKFYHSAAWRKARKRQLDEFPFCAECEKHGKLTPANTVDHIVRIQDGGAKLDPANFRSLCPSCHAKVSGRQSQESRRKKP